MNPRVKVWLILVGAFALLGGSVVGLYLKKTGENLYEQFYERAAFRAQYFAGLAARYRESPDTLERLLSTVFIATDVLYVQVVQSGKVVATHERSESFTLTLEPFDRVLLIRERRTAAGASYWDVFYSLDALDQAEPQPGGPSYVRLGVALAPLEQEWQRELLAVSFVAVIFLGVAAALLWWLTSFFTIQISRPVTADEAALASAISISSSSGSPTEEEPEAPDSQTDLTEKIERVTASLQIDDLSKRVFINGAEIKLSPKEYELLRLLASEPGRVFSNEEILQAVWVGRQWATAQDVKQYIYFLRKKLEDDPEQPRYIITVRGFGYKLQL